ncbi:MAG TPA: hypothetical protein VL405_02645 [Sphingomonas sp.]|nr:hypothetical protein [Sphingomonas sp.]
MKIKRMLAAAGLLAATLGATTSASAQEYRGDNRYETVHRDRDVRDERRDDRQWGNRDRDDRQWNGRDRDDRRVRYDHRDRGNHYGWRNGRGHHCRTVWHHHRRVRVCR